MKPYHINAYYFYIIRIICQVRLYQGCETEIKNNINIFLYAYF